VITDLYFKNQFYVIVGAIVGLTLTFFCIKRYLLSHSCTAKSFDLKYQAVILRHNNAIDVDQG